MAQTNTLSIEEATKQADDLLSGAITEFTQPLKIPDFNVTDTTRANETLNRAEVTGGKFNETVETSKKDLKTSTEAEKEAIGKEGQAKADLAIATGQREQQVAEGYRNAQRLFGMDLSPDAAIAKAVQAQNKERSTLALKRDRVNQLQSSSLLDNPIDYFMGAFELPVAVSDYNTSVDKINSLQNAIDDGLKSANDAGALNAKGIPTITTSMAASNANFALAEAARKKVEADKNLAMTNVDFASKQLALDLSLATATRETTHLDQENERLKYESLVRAIQFADTHAARMEGAAKLLYDLADKRGLDVLLRQYDRTIGNPEGTTNRQVFNRLPASARENIAAIGAGSAGTNPYEAMGNITRTGPLLSPETGRLLNFIQEKEAVIKRDPLVDPKTQAARIGKQLKENIEEEWSNPSKSAIFREMSPASMIANNSVVHGSKLEQTLLPLAKSGGPVPTNTIMETISTAYPNANEAGQVAAEYYRRNIELRNKSLNMGLVGMQPPTSYKVLAPNDAIFGRGPKFVFDLTKDEEATKYMVLLKAQQKARETGEGLVNPESYMSPVSFNPSEDELNVEKQPPNIPVKQAKIPGTADNPVVTPPTTFGAVKKVRM